MSVPSRLRAGRFLNALTGLRAAVWMFSPPWPKTRTSKIVRTTHLADQGDAENAREIFRVEEREDPDQGDHEQRRPVHETV